MIFNQHIHIFTEFDVPREFLPLELVRILATKDGFNIVAKILNTLNPLSDHDTFKRYLRFVEIGKLGSQQKILEECMKYYPSDTRYNILSMDMKYMGCGVVPRNFDDQIKELAELKKIYPQITPFIHVDPRRPNIYSLMTQAVEQWGFGGIKLYPALGYFPYDKRLYPFYEYAQKHNLPIIAHCSPNNPVHYKGSKGEIKELLKDSITPVDTHCKTKKELCANFTNPKNYEYVMRDFPDLKICVAHFGSSYYWDEFLNGDANENNWLIVIKNMIQKYNNFYTDISFTMNNTKYFPLLKVLMTNDKVRSHVLFGSDFYMTETKCDERRFSIELRAFLGEEYFNDIANINPRIFMGETI